MLMHERAITETKYPKLLLTVEEAAQVLSLGRSLFYELMQRNRIESVKIGSARRIPYSALQRFVEQLSLSESEED